MTRTTDRRVAAIEEFRLGYPTTHLAAILASWGTVGSISGLAYAALRVWHLSGWGFAAAYLLPLLLVLPLHDWFLSTRIRINDAGLLVRHAGLLSKGIYIPYTLVHSTRCFLQPPGLQILLRDGTAVELGPWAHIGERRLRMLVGQAAESIERQLAQNRVAATEGHEELE